MTRIPADVPDTELVWRLRAGDATALKVLYGRYCGLVYSLAFKMLDNATEAEDLTQEVFLTFWKNEKFDPDRAALSTYLCVMVRSRALNRLKSNDSRQRTLERLQSFEPLELSTPTPLEQASCSEKEETLRDALAQLPEKNRQVLEMNYYQGLSHREISQQLGIPLGTVKTNARKGLMLLRQILGDAVG
ncbi:MAG: sigma-70 family RNA polymerase sigma factor [Cyanobacteria bacterium SID2]|nr:sigma-70 family RNA polymerase sigma factor [Cyanobacteria bacterium SID2]MBP0002464.1 sigma-70 family RNA polymerase sigma factor [Cyanobacteria bacterium SBC]